MRDDCGHMNNWVKRALCFFVACYALVGNVMATKMVKGKPFVKWAGGKGQLIEQLESLFPSEISSGKDITYIEPFVGGGAMVFYILEKYPNISRVIINDFNDHLVGVYRTIRDRPDELIEALSKLQNEYSACEGKDARRLYYLNNREIYNSGLVESVERSALFIFLNRTCFNGLYRVNSKGEFNVPFGKSANPLICDAETIRRDSELLQRVEILQGDFEGVYERITGKAFVYFDPPYRPLPLTASFTAYSKDGFNDEQQKRLASFCRKLDREGHLWLLSNSDPSNTDASDRFFDDLYEGFEIKRVYASRAINSNAQKRGKITELAIRNYKEK